MKRKNYMFKRQVGFTLIELMVTVIILAILAAVAVPNVRGLIQNNRMTSASNELMTAMYLARSEAIKRGRPVAICASNDGASCSGGWADGWLVVVDTNNAGAVSVDIDDDDDIVRIWGELGGTMSFAGGGDLPGFLRFLPDGRIDRLAISFPVDFQMRIENCRMGAARDIRVTPLGRVNIDGQEC